MIPAIIGAISSALPITITIPVPATPTLLGAYSVLRNSGSTQVHVVYNGVNTNLLVPQATYYLATASPGNLTASGFIGGVGAGGIYFNNLSANTKYNFRIVSVNDGGSSSATTNTVYSNLPSASFAALGEAMYYDSYCMYYTAVGKVGRNNWIYGNSVNLIDAPVLAVPDSNQGAGIGYAAIQNNTIGIQYQQSGASAQYHLTNDGGGTWYLLTLPNTNPFIRIWAKNNYFFEIDWNSQTTQYSASARYSTSGSAWTNFQLPFVANSTNLFGATTPPADNKTFFTYVNGYYVFSMNNTDVYSTSATPTAWTSSTVWSKNVFPLGSTTNLNRGYYGYASGTYFSFATASSGAANTIMVSTNASTWVPISLSSVYPSSCFPVAGFVNSNGGVTVVLQGPGSLPTNPNAYASLWALNSSSISGSTVIWSSSVQITSGIPADYGRRFSYDGSVWGSDIILYPYNQPYDRLYTTDGVTWTIPSLTGFTFQDTILFNSNGGASRFFNSEGSYE